MFIERLIPILEERDTRNDVGKPTSTGTIVHMTMTKQKTSTDMHGESLLSKQAGCTTQRFQ